MDTLVAKKVEIFFSKFKIRTVKKSEILIRAGEAPLGIFYLPKGKIKKYSLSQNGDEHIINIFKPVSFFPISWVMNSFSNEYFYESLIESEVRIAPKEDLLKFLKSESDVLYDLLSRVYKGIFGMEKRMFYLMNGTAYAKLIVEIILQAKRFGSKVDKSIELKIKESELAAESGMTRETVSREIKILKDKGFLTLSRSKIIINDLRLLEEELENRS